MGKDIRKYILINTDKIVKGSTPESAAKKAWACNKHLDLIIICDVETEEEHGFDSTKWFIVTKNGKRKFK